MISDKHTKIIEKYEKDKREGKIKYFVIIPRTIDKIGRVK